MESGRRGVRFYGQSHCRLPPDLVAICFVSISSRTEYIFSKNFARQNKIYLGLIHKILSEEHNIHFIPKALSVLKGAQTLNRVHCEVDPVDGGVNPIFITCVNMCEPHIYGRSFLQLSCNLWRNIKSQHCKVDTVDEGG